MHIPFLIPREHVQLQPRVSSRLLATHTAFSKEVIVARHSYMWAVLCRLGCLFTFYGLRSDGAALLRPIHYISQGSAPPLGQYMCFLVIVP